MSALVWVVMGSPSDLEVAREVTCGLTDLGISWEVRVASAHRTPHKALQIAQDAEKQGVQVIVGIAGKAAALPGLIAAVTPLPVIGIPVASPELGGIDALYSMTQLPKGTPLATMGLGRAGAANGALLAGRIVALSRPEVRERLRSMDEAMAKSVEDGEAKVRAQLAPPG